MSFLIALTRATRKWFALALAFALIYLPMLSFVDCEAGCELGSRAKGVQERDEIIMALYRNNKM